MEIHVLRIGFFGFLRPQLTVLSVLEQIDVCVLLDTSGLVAPRSV